MEGNGKAKAILEQGADPKTGQIIWPVFGVFRSFPLAASRNTLQRVFIDLTLRIRTAKFIFFLFDKKGLCADRIHFFLDFFITCGNSGKQ